MSDGRTSVSRAIPTFSIDSGLLFERDALWFGRGLRQTLEPRLLYVNTPLRQQAMLPLFDTAPKDFNTVSVFSDNAFTGVDRVSDGHQVTAGVTSRWLDTVSGAEALRLGLAQRYLLRDQQITPDGVPLTQRFSDVLLDGSARSVGSWIRRSGVSVQPRSQASHAFGAPHQLHAGTDAHAGRQLPARARRQRIRRPGLAVAGVPRDTSGSNSGCRGTLYSVGRVNYSVRDSRITDSLAGFEYDAGCWIGRIVAERVSTGRTEATTRLLLQLELVGLSRLGTNPLQVLKDNIPGYTLLRDDRTDPPLREYTQ